jgi:hypothetical protein
MRNDSASVGSMMGGGPLVPEQRASDARTALLGVALLMDAAALLVLRPLADATTLRHRAAIEFVLLFVDLVLTRTILAREGPSRATAVRVVIAIEAFVLLAWLQALGTTSSALLALCPLLVLFYRVAYGRAASMFCLALVAGGKGLLFAGESAGLVPIAPLFEHASDAWVIRAGGLALALAADGGVFVLANLAAAIRTSARAPDAAQASRRTPARANVVSRPEIVSASGLRNDGLDDARTPSSPVVPGYRIGEVIGRGGMGDVHKATREDDGREVAIKILHPHLDGAPDIIERFRREALFTSKLPSARVARVLDVGHDTHAHYLVMDLLSGEDLAARLARAGTLSVDHAVLLAEQLAEVLDVAHAAGIVHRDVKPQNIFVEDHDPDAASSTKIPSFRLLDFGVARLLEDPSGSRASKTVGLLGTPGYLAPEQVSDKFGAVSPRTDVFAVGAVLYRALTGCSAFPSRQTAAAIHEAVHLHPAAPSSVRADLPKDIDSVLAIAMAKAQSDRYASLSELARDLTLARNGALSSERRERARAIGASAVGSRTITSAA